MKSATILLAALVGYVQATTYAQFCDDHACTENCGISVSTDNPGCLNESGRNSIKFHDDNIQEVNLVFSPTPNCPCQTECINVVACGEGVCGGKVSCMDLAGHHPAESFRFVGGGSTSCSANNC
ncbi:Hypothetical protein R9X50_00073200 [Acrodontium crateriforme]|uniref:Uncharacterized protein n=1 Tax=Acrodontium crateriforme TaxID=150365 RepID=A0AAQ3LZC3_9PEZI|nr:Hypothetical protein R9X50_00073200 [Acrodontium crateriforme]